MWPNSITIPPLLHVFQYYIQICVLNLSHSFTAFATSLWRFQPCPQTTGTLPATSSRFLMSVGRSSRESPKMLPPVVSRHCRIVPPEAWEVSKLHFEDDFWILKMCWCFFSRMEGWFFPLEVLMWRTFKLRIYHDGRTTVVGVFKKHC